MMIQTTPRPRLSHAAKMAQKLVSEAKIKSPPVDLDIILANLKLNKMEHDFPKDISGIFFRENELTVIGINKSMYENRKNFTVAHEIGHYVLGHHLDTYVDADAVADSRYDSTCRNPIQEQEANHFAGELLMPAEMLNEDFKRNKDTKALASKYEVSEQALWIRLMKLKLV